MSPTIFVKEIFEIRPRKIYKNSNRPEGRVNIKSGRPILIQRWTSEWHQMISKNSYIKYVILQDIGNNLHEESFFKFDPHKSHKK